ncbi:MAG: lipooligosaccharide phosphoethanolamine transferase [Rickettsiales bacterium]|nr:MAG: lipooligosaccharide phosphoethanolamine transferase [Rickettsiales bacterium]
MKKKNKIINFFKTNRIAFHIIFVLFFWFLLLADDLIFKIFNSANKVGFFNKWTLLALLPALILSFANKKTTYIFLSFFAFFETTQFAYFAYFGIPIDPAMIPLIFLEIPEIATTGFGDFGKTYYAFISVALPYSILFYTIKKHNAKLFKCKYLYILLIIALSYFPHRAFVSKNIATLLANPERPTLYNGFKIYSAYLFNILPKQEKIKEYLPYTIQKEKPFAENINIILVMGESFNQANSQLYGYKKETNPLLTKLKKEGNLIVKKGISGAIWTSASLPTFFDLTREPDNYFMHIKKEFNLFKLAKENGFKTYWLSAQSQGVSNNTGIQWQDIRICEETIKTDDDLLENLKKYNLNEGRNFIVLHQRNMHSPYTYYKNRDKQFEKFENNYDNSMLYNDTLLNEIIDYVKSESKNPYFIFITSDHGEYTGQRGRLGHGILEPFVSQVPMFLHTSQKNNSIYDKFNQESYITHYELSLYIAELMGYKVENPNMVEDKIAKFFPKCNLNTGLVKKRSS